MFIEQIKEKIINHKKTIVLVESEDERILQAASKCLAENVVNIILVGKKDDIIKKASTLSINIDNATIVNPIDFKNTEHLISIFYEMRKHKLGSIDDAKNVILNDKLYFSCMLVAAGYADGLVAGAVYTSSSLLKAALQTVKTKAGIKASSFTLIDISQNEKNDYPYLFADTGLNQEPTANELAEIAYNSTQSYKLLTNNTPFVAFLSHSTKGSAPLCPSLIKIKEAVRLTKDIYPNIIVDGELQFDAAINEEVAKIKAPDSSVAGKANVLIFPDLNSANIAYKIAERFGHAKAYGPITQGLNKPINDLSRGCNINDIYGVILITALQAKNM